MFTVGITGGIGSGKSKAAQRFEHLGVPVVDADVIARQVVEPGLPALDQIKQEFGEHVIGADGHLDRSALRHIIFSDQEHKNTLENILHPIIYSEVVDALSRQTASYAIVVIPLLAESKRNYPIDRILVIDAPSAIQQSRVTARDRQTAQEVRRIIDMQASRRDRLKIADDVYLNTGTVAELNAWVDAKHSHYLELAAKGSSASA